jgi:hypothetical protein
LRFVLKSKEISLLIDIWKVDFTLILNVFFFMFKHLLSSLKRVLSCEVLLTSSIVMSGLSKSATVTYVWGRFSFNNKKVGIEFKILIGWKIFVFSESILAFTLSFYQFSQYPVSFSSNIGSLADMSVPRADKGSDIKKKFHVIIFYFILVLYSHPFVINLRIKAAITQIKGYVLRNWIKGIDHLWKCHYIMYNNI